MTSETTTRTRVRAITLAFAAAWTLWALCGPAFSDPTAKEVQKDKSPGSEAVQSLRRALVTPTAAARWRGLPEFGRELFEGSEARFGPAENGPVGPDYVLGPGDNLVMFVSGYSDSIYSLTLDREGKVFVPRIGAVFLGGLAFADAERLLQSRLASVLRNTRVQVSMGRLRAFDVFVLGAAVRPGKYTLNGLATAFNALLAAGGPSELGGLRDLRVLRGNQEVARLDLYPFLLAGDRSNDTRLQGGDVVFVGLARAHVGIQGAVMRPAVYETGNPITLRTLLDMAGGATAFADLSRVRIERVDANGGFRLQDLPLRNGHGIDADSLVLSNFDLVTVMPLNERTRNVVTLDGYVRQEGEYELAPGMHLSQLITPERLLPEADLERAELRRVDPQTFQVEVQSVSPKRVWAGEGDVELRPLDAVTVFSTARFPRSISIEGEVMRPGTYAVVAGERLSHALTRAGGLTPQGFIPAAIFIRSSAAARERAFMSEFVQRQRIDLASQRTQLAQAGDSAAATAVAKAEDDLVLALADQTDPGRVVLDLDPEGRWVDTPKDPVIEDGDRLLVPLRPATVTVLGSVMNPGSMMARRSGSLEDYLKLAGGASRQADLGRAYVFKANGAAIPRASVKRIEPGDAIVVPPREAKTGSAGRTIAAGTRFLMELAATAALITAATR
jgi:protein involved in polysaccharide export with SLBB domain